MSQHGIVPAIRPMKAPDADHQRPVAERDRQPGDPVASLGW
jgi:hypothetical protein